MSQKELTLNKSIMQKARFAKRVLTSFEMKVTLTLLVFALGSLWFVLFAQGYRIHVEPTGKILPPFSVSFTFDYTARKDFIVQDEQCVAFGSEMKQFFTDPTLSCDCYYDLNKTDNKELDIRTRPFCTCSCTNDTTTTVIGIRI